MQKILLLFLLSFIADKTMAQEGNEWYIENNSRINFTCRPAQITTIPYSQTENPAGTLCTSIADTNGHLLFYSSSRSVWNRENKMMPHGKDVLQQLYYLSILNSMYIVPDPANPNRYYLFFNDLYDFTNTVWDPYNLNYALIDMSLDSGRGDVVMVKRDLVRHVSGLSATHQPDKKDYWLATFQLSDTDTYVNGKIQYVDSLVLFSITENGITKHSLPTDTFKSTINWPLPVFSNDGKKICVFTGDNNPWYVMYDFDKAKCTINNRIYMPNIPGGQYIQSLVFSPDDSKLYVFTSGNSTMIQQYEIKNDQNTSDIGQTQVLLENATGVNGLWYDPRVASDGKIYALCYDNYLKSIDFPNKKGDSCHLNRTAVFLGQYPNTVVQDYLPRFITRHPEVMPYDVSNFCSGAAVSFVPFANLHSPGWHWDFGDPASGAANTSAQRTGVHTYTNPGTYKVHFIAANYDSVVDTFTRFVCISAAPPKPKSMDTALCTGETATLNPGTPGYKYFWNDGDTTPTKKAGPGTYWVNISNGGCTLADTAHVADASNGRLNLGNDTTIRLGMSLTLHAGNDKAVWSTGATGPSITVTQAGSYWAAIKGDKCEISDTIAVKTIKSGIEEAGNALSGVNLYPNPAHNVLSIHYMTEGNTQDYVLTVVDVKGQTVLTQKFTSAEGNNTFSLNMASLTPGTYSLQLQSKGKMFQTGFVKQ